MPRVGTIAADIAHYLKRRPKGATIEQIQNALVLVRRSPVLRHSVRSALHQHADGKGENLFMRMDRGTYALRR